MKVNQVMIMMMRRRRMVSDIASLNVPYKRGRFQSATRTPDCSSSSIVAGQVRNVAGNLGTQ